MATLLASIPLLAASQGCVAATERCDDTACDDSTSSTVASGSTAAGTSATGSSSTGTGGGLADWIAPPCTTVMGTAAVTFSNDGAITTALNDSPPLTGIAYTFGIAALDTPGVVAVDHAGELFVSRDAGCHFESVGETGLNSAALTGAVGGVAYGWVDNDAGLYRYEAGSSDPAGPIVPLTSPAAHIVGLGVDPSRPFEVRLMAASGQVFKSTDRGAHFDPIGLPCPAPAGLVYRAAFDPNDLGHVVCAVAKDGVLTTTNGGNDWTKASGLGEKANGFSATISPVEGGVVWLEGLTLLPVEARHVFRSEDGGLTFAPVVHEESGVMLTNGAPMWAHPKDPNVLLFEFGTDFQGYGTDIYVYDHALGSVKIHHHDFDQVAALAFSPFDPDILYLGISSEQIQ